MRHTTQHAKSATELYLQLSVVSDGLASQSISGSLPLSVFPEHQTSPSPNEFSAHQLRQTDIDDSTSSIVSRHSSMVFNSSVKALTPAWKNPSALFAALLVRFIDSIAVMYWFLDTTILMSCPWFLWKSWIAPVDGSPSDDADAEPRLCLTAFSVSVTVDATICWIWSVLGAPFDPFALPLPRLCGGGCNSSSSVLIGTSTTSMFAFATNSSVTSGELCQCLELFFKCALSLS